MRIRHEVQKIEARREVLSISEASLTVVEQQKCRIERRSEMSQAGIENA
jgi:hypothetical protein